MMSAAGDVVVAEAAFLHIHALSFITDDAVWVVAVVVAAAAIMDVAVAAAVCRVPYYVSLSVPASPVKDCYSWGARGGGEKVTHRRA